MKITDYSKIAERYDKNEYRTEEMRVDSDLKDYINNHIKPVYHVLDLASGTGI